MGLQKHGENNNSQSWFCSLQKWLFLIGQLRRKMEEHWYLRPSSMGLKMNKQL